MLDNMLSYIQKKKPTETNKTKNGKRSDEARRQVIEEGVVYVGVLRGQRGQVSANGAH